jgi:hypothetical protein
LSLLPWNRRQPLTVGLVRRTFLSAPVRGSIVDALNEPQRPLQEAPQGAR